MAFITNATRKVVIDHVVATLGRAPTTKELADVTVLLNDGASLADVAGYLTSSAAYRSKYPVGQTASEAAADILDAAIVGGVLAADIRLAVIDLIAGGLTGGAYTIATATNAVVAYLSDTANNDNADLGDIAKAFQNRTAAAEEFTTTFTLEGATVTEADLAAAVEGVTSDAATLTAAKAAFAAGNKGIAAQAAADKAVADAAAAKAAEEKAAADAAAAKAAEEKAAADKAAADAAAAKAAEEKAAADAAAAEKVLTDAYTAAAAEAATAIAASEAADAALIAAQTASEAAATKAALTDATALTAATTAATAADTAAKAAVVAATTAYEAALVAGVAADVSTANGSLLIANNNAAVAAAALVAATAASDAATADDAAAATAAAALTAATTASDTAAAAADAAAAAAVIAAAATADTDDDTAAAVLVTEAAASNPTGDAAAAAAAAAKAAADKAIADQAAADKAAADKAAADKAIADAAAAAEALKQTITLTTGIDTKEGGVADDTFVANATTFSVGDNLKGGEGSDTLAISDVADAMSAVPASVTLDSIEKITIATSGDLGVVGGSAAVAQVNTYAPITVTADVAGTTRYVAGATTAADGTHTITYNGNTVGYLGDADAPATTATNIAAAINTAAGSTIATVGKAHNGGGGTAFVADVAAGGTSVDLVNASATGIVVGMTVTSDDVGTFSAGTYVSAVSVGATNTTITFSQAIPAGQDIDADADTLTFGGGTGGITVVGAGTSQPTVGFSNATGITASAVISAVDGNEGSAVTVNYGDSSAQYLIGSSATATGANLAAAINGLAGSTIATASTGTVTVTAPTAGTALPAIKFSGTAGNTPAVTFTTANTAAGATAAAYDVSTLTTEEVVVTLADSANLKASTGDNVTVSGVTGAITVNGGLAVTVTDATANKAIDLDNAKGAVVVTDTKQGTAAIGVGEGTNVDVTASSVSTGTVTVGDSATAISGTINVSSTGSAYATTTANTTLGAITTTSGTTVDVTQSATSSTAAAAADTTAATITQSAVTVNAGNSTTAITVTQDPVATANNAVTGIAAKAAAHTIVFTAMASGDVTTLTLDTSDTIVFTASKALTALEAASAFANLAKGAVTGSAASTDGVYTTAGTIDQGWYSGDAAAISASTAGVVFNNATGTATITSIANAGTGTATLGAVVAGNSATLAETGVMGVGTGAIDINGASVKDAVTEVTLTNFASSNIESDVLSTLNLTGSAGNTVVSTASVGSVTANLNGITGNITLDSGTATVTGLTINASGKKVDSQVTADAVTALTINAGVAVDLTNSSFDKAKSMTVTGAGTVTLDGDAGTSVLAAVDASQATGTVNASGVALTAAGIYTGGSGADTFTVTASATKASTGGAGNDVITVSTFSTGGSVDAGDGIDTLVMAASDAATADANTLFAQNLANFEVLALGVLGTENIVTSNLGLNSQVVTNGTTGAATVSGLAANATVTINAAITTSLTAALAVSTGTSDVINLSTNIDGALTAGKVIVASVETVNLSAVDKFVDVSGSFDAFGNAIPNGVDDTNSVQSISLDIDEATTLNITGSADLTVDILDTNNSGADIKTSLVDASAFTGKLTLIADGLIAGTTVKGGSGADTLTADGSSDTLIGNAGNDKLVGTLLTTLTGGAGNDTFVIETVTALTTYSTITDLSSGDVIDTTATNFITTAVSLASSATFSDYATAAIVAATGSAGADGAAWFQFGSNTYLVVEGDTSGGATYDATEDAIVEITGLVDLSAAAFNATNGQFTI